MEGNTTERAGRGTMIAGWVVGAWAVALGVHSLIFESGPGPNRAYLTEAAVLGVIAVVLFFAAVTRKRWARRTRP